MSTEVDFARYHVERSTTIAATPAVVYDLVADVTRMGEWSPACTGGRWTNADRSRFVGTNEAGELQWETMCRVAVAERGKEFTFFNTGFDGAADLVRWSYRFEATEAGTLTTETWIVLPAYADVGKQLTKDLPGFLDEMAEIARRGMAETLRNLRQAAESETPR